MKTCDLCVDGKVYVPVGEFDIPTYVDCKCAPEPHRVTLPDRDEATRYVNAMREKYRVNRSLRDQAWARTERRFGK